MQFFEGCPVSIISKYIKESNVGEKTVNDFLKLSNFALNLLNDMEIGHLFEASLNCNVIQR